MPIKIERIFCPFDKESKDADYLLFPLVLAGDFCAMLFYCFCWPKTSRDSVLAARREINGLVEKKLEGLDSGSAARSVKWKTCVVKSADKAAKIVCQAARNKTDLIVVRRSTRNSSSDVRLGVVTESLCRTAHSSVLVLPPDEFQDQGFDGKIGFRKILAAYDFSDYSELALQTATALSEKYEAELHLLHVLAEPRRLPSGQVWSDETAGSLYHQTLTRLQTALAVQTGAFPISAAVRWGKSYREILRYTVENKIDLIAMGAQGRDFGFSSLFGSNVDRVLRQSPCAVLVARPFRPSCAEN